MYCANYLIIFNQLTYLIQSLFVNHFLYHKIILWCVMLSFFVYILCPQALLGVTLSPSPLRVVQRSRSVKVTPVMDVATAA